MQEGLICLISYPGNDGMGWKPYSGFHNRVYECCEGIFGKKNTGCIAFIKHSADWVCFQWSTHQVSARTSNQH